MSQLRLGLFGLSVLGVAAWSAGSVQAGGRMFSGGHPYHNGYLFVPPASAYEAVSYRPPMWYGAPAYYYPASYLARGYVGPVQYPHLFHGPKMMPLKRSAFYSIGSEPIRWRQYP